MSTPAPDTQESGSTTDELSVTDGHQDVGDQGHDIPDPDLDPADVDVSDIVHAESTDDAS